MNFLSDGNVDYDIDDLISIIKSGNDINGMFSSDKIHIDPFKKNMKIFEGIDCAFDKKEINHEQNQKQWNIPSNYFDINLRDYFLEKSNGSNQERIEFELNRFYELNLKDVLFFSIFIVDYMREHEIVWGVGRGSSVCSYLLYLIGIHKVDPIKYDLDFNEFL